MTRETREAVARQLLASRIDELRAMDRAGIEALPGDKSDRTIRPGNDQVSWSTVDHATDHGTFHVTTYVETMGEHQRKVVVQIGCTKQLPRVLRFFERSMLMDMDGFVIQSDGTKREMTDEEGWDYS